MTSLIDAPVSVRATVDDYLGPGDRRFFGKGYKRADQNLRSIRIETTGDGKGHVTARAAVSYPDDWSRKGKTNQPPHLSSIDVLLVAGELAEMYLTHALSLDSEQRSSMRLRRVVIKAGRSPVEEELVDFGVSAVITPQDASSLPEGTAVSLADCQVGALRVHCEIEHPQGAPEPAPGAYASPAELLGPSRLRPYAHGHKAKSQIIEDLELETTGLCAHAVLATRCDIPEFPAVGLESYSHKGASLIDAFVAAIQLGQILLYELDSVKRSESNTLWMRQTVLEINEPRVAVLTPSRISTRLEELQLLTTREGEVWRSCDMVSEFQNIDIRCSVAHRLPRARGEGTEHA
ncbi:AvrD family protein [Streptomyces sp. NBC_00503]|uniref:AvrD family protein n=1 Tax=Streptomyces sp. NBC_00503 TaxID=2903659 RepID=UPI002E811F3E|nr:AvrD family protein [Streptomyces sp. NBC_00503]WUD86373.1 AvrD family protein [Streptomyces sp. NBC_00503]